MNTLLISLLHFDITCRVCTPSSTSWQTVLTTWPPGTRKKLRAPPFDWPVADDPTNYNNGWTSSLQVSISGQEDSANNYTHYKKYLITMNLLIVILLHATQLMLKILLHATQVMSRKVPLPPEPDLTVLFCGKRSA